jgi:kynurenine formamidase
MPPQKRRMTENPGEVIDLSAWVEPLARHHPDVTPVRVDIAATFERDGCFAQRWQLDEHSGTHVDAAAHFTAGAPTVDRIPVSNFVLPAAVLDVRHRAPGGGFAVGIDDVLAWERANGELPHRCVLLACTGWAENRPSVPDELCGRDRSWDWPGFAGELAEFVVERRPQVIALGIDSPSLDTCSAEQRGSPVHRHWLRGHRYGLENLRALHRLPAVGATVFVGALRLAAGSGAPARVLAVVTAPAALAGDVETDRHPDRTVR